jgi:hypothetical protein
VDYGPPHLLRIANTDVPPQQSSQVDAFQSRILDIE